MPFPHEQFKNLHLFDHPLVQDKLTRARDRNTSTFEFRRRLNEIAGLMTYDVCRELRTRARTVETPVGPTEGRVLDEPVTLVPILRAGIGMTSGILGLLPEARVGHIGLYRDESTLEPVEYYAKLPPDIADGDVFVVDPMLATGGSASAALTQLKSRSVSRISLICLVVAPEGVARVEREHPEVAIYAAALDDKLNDKGYIVPGLGDAGDRLFGTQ